MQFTILTSCHPQMLGRTSDLCLGSMQALLKWPFFVKICPQAAIKRNRCRLTLASHYSMYYTCNLMHVNSPTDPTAVTEARPNCRYYPPPQCEFSPQARNMKAKGTVPTQGVGDSREEQSVVEPSSLSLASYQGFKSLLNACHLSFL